MICPSLGRFTCIGICSGIRRQRYDSQRCLTSASSFAISAAGFGDPCAFHRIHCGHRPDAGKQRDDRNDHHELDQRDCRAMASAAATRGAVPFSYADHRGDGARAKGNSPRRDFAGWDSRRSRVTPRPPHFPNPLSRGSHRLAPGRKCRRAWAAREGRNRSRPSSISRRTSSSSAGPK